MLVFFKEIFQRPFFGTLAVSGRATGTGLQEISARIF